MIYRCTTGRAPHNSTPTSHMSPQAFSSTRYSPAPVLLQQKASKSHKELQDQTFTPQRAASSGKNDQAFGRSHETNTLIQRGLHNAAQVQARKSLSFSARMARVATWDTAPRIRAKTSEKISDEMQSKMQYLANEIQAVEERLAGQGSFLTQGDDAASPSLAPSAFTSGAQDDCKLQDGPSRQYQPQIEIPWSSGEQEKASEAEAITLQLLPKKQSEQDVWGALSAAENGPPFRPPDILSHEKEDGEETSVRDTDEQGCLTQCSAATNGAPPTPPALSPAAGISPATSGHAFADKQRAGIGIIVHEQEGKIVVTRVKKGSRYSAEFIVFSECTRACMYAAESSLMHTLYQPWQQRG